MKRKTYISPAVDVTYLSAQQIICQSLSLGSTDAVDGDNGVSDVDGSMLSRHKSLWDDDEE